MNRRTFLLFPLAAVPVAGYARYVEPTWLELGHHTVPLAGLIPGTQIRVVQLSDLHASPVVPASLIEQSIDIALAQKPDILCLTGDFITAGNSYDATWYRRVLRRIPDRVRCFASLGNHDGGTRSPDYAYYSTDGVIRLLKDSGVPLLHNRSIDLTVRSQQIRLVGLGDWWAQQCRPEIAFDGLANQPKLPTVVLSHNPDTKDLMATHKWDLMLSGHTHGGQVVCPVLGLSPAPVRDRGYIKGLNAWRDRWIHTTPGIGNIGGVRFDCRPQVSVLDLTSHA